MDIIAKHRKVRRKKMLPNLRFPDFTEFWSEKKYGDVFKFKQTNSLSRDSLNYDKGTVKNIHYGDIHTKFQTNFDISNEEVPFINKNVDISKIKNENYCRNGDLVIADASEDYGDVGKTIEMQNLHNQKLVAGLHTYIARSNNGSFSPGFAGYLMQSWTVRLQVMMLAQGTKVHGISSRHLADVIFKTPSLPEQQKIASFLSTVDQKIQQLTRKKELLEQYKKGVMQKLFSQEIRFKDENGKDYPDWEKKRLDAIILDYRLGGNYANSETITHHPLIKMGNLGRGNINLDKLEYISEGEQIDSKDVINYGDLFFNTRNTLELVGKVAIWRAELSKAYYNSNLMLLKFENNLFMNYRFNSYEGIKGLRRLATGTTSVAAIYTRDLLKLKLSVPSIEEQKKIADLLASIDKKIEAMQNQITQTQQFKKGLLQQMFV